MTSVTKAVFPVAGLYPELSDEFAAYLAGQDFSGAALA